MRARAATATLVKQDNPENRGVKIATHCGAASAPRPAMQHDNRYSIRVASLFHINAVAITHIHHPLVKRINRRV
jgi:hypothetical protein